MLTKRSHIAPVLALALALPGAGLAAAPTAASATPIAGAPTAADAAPIGFAPARALTIAPLQEPIDRFQHIVHVAAEQIREEEREQRAQRRRQRELRLQRQRREAFASLPGGVSSSTLEAIAACESGGDPGAVSADGSYRGLYQFDYGTWESVGGTGDPAAASADEQTYRAALLYSRSGSSPWPICG